MQRLGRGMLAQGFDLKKNVYNNRLQPYIAYWGAFWTALFILVNGFKVFFKWNVSDFLTACKYQKMMLIRFLLLTSFARHRCSHLCSVVSILENLEAYIVLESGGNGPCYGTLMISW